MKINCTHSELIELHKIIPNPKNPNKHPDDQIERLAKIIDYQGQRHPIIISKRSGFVVVGHGRFEAIKKLGWEKAAIDYQDFESEAQEYAFVVADNAIAEWAQLDLAQINVDMVDLGPELDLEQLGIKDFIIEPLDKEFPALSGETPSCQKITFTLSNDQVDLLERAIAKALKEEHCEDELNANSRGNALSSIVVRYVHG